MMMIMMMVEFLFLSSFRLFTTPNVEHGWKAMSLGIITMTSGNTSQEKNRFFSGIAQITGFVLIYIGSTCSATLYNFCVGVKPPSNAHQRMPSSFIAKVCQPYLIFVIFLHSHILSPGNFTLGKCVNL